MQQPAVTKATNPFYVMLMPVGVVFALTACSYTLMAYRGRDPHHAADNGLISLMEQHGLVIMAIELGLLAILTMAAIGSDSYWSRRSGADGDIRP